MAAVSTLVDDLGLTRVALESTNRNQSRRLIMQARAFGEHDFTRLKCRAVIAAYVQPTSLDQPLPISRPVSDPVDDLFLGSP